MSKSENIFFWIGIFFTMIFSAPLCILIFIMVYEQVYIKILEAYHTIKNIRNISKGKIKNDNM